MSPRELSLHLKRKGRLAAGYLFLGAEPFYRSRCVSFLRERILGPAGDAGFLINLDLKSDRLGDVLDEADSPPLFGGPRLLLARNADGALRFSRGRAGKQDKARLAAYFREPMEDTVVVFDVAGHAWEDWGGKGRLQRVSKLFAAVPERVDFRALREADAVYVGEILAKRMKLRISRAVLRELVEALGADAYRLESEIEKLQLFAGGEREITAADISLLVPEARQRGMFEFSDAIADRDRTKALDVLDTMAKAGMYWGLQVSTLASLLRQALAAKEAGARSPAQIRQRLARVGINVWQARAAQIHRVARRYTAKDLRRALVALFEADRGLRSPRPDDRIVMERLVMELTS